MKEVRRTDSGELILRKTRYWPVRGIVGAVTYSGPFTNRRLYTPV